jgi:hypothetical protein
MGKKRRESDETYIRSSGENARANTRKIATTILSFTADLRTLSAWKLAASSADSTPNLTRFEAHLSDEHAPSPPTEKAVSVVGQT